MRQPARAILLACTVIVATLLLFQNCSDQLGLEEDQASLSDTLPFAYDTTIDTVAYMSCAGGTTSANRQAIWSFRVGAFNAGSGLRLTDEYLNMTQNFNVEQRAAALSESAKNSNAVLQLAIRQGLNYQSVLTSGGGSGQLGEDFSSLLGPLDGTVIGTTISDVDVAAPQRFTYFAGMAGLTGRRIEGAIRFTDNETEAQSVRGQLSNTGVLTATYTADSAADTSARGPAGAANDRVFGRGYRLTFVAPSAGEPEPRLIGSIDEFNLATGNPTGLEVRPWVCPLDLRLRIFRACGTGCACTTDGAPNPYLNTIRNVLKVEHWYVDVVNRCIVQKEVANQCYPTSVPGNYNFVSICTRQ